MVGAFGLLQALILLTVTNDQAFLQEGNWFRKLIYSCRIAAVVPTD